MKIHETFEMGPVGPGASQPESFTSWWDSIPDGTVLEIKRVSPLSTIVLVTERCGFRFITPRVDFTWEEFTKIQVLGMGLTGEEKDEHLQILFAPSGRGPRPKKFG